MSATLFLSSPPLPSKSLNFSPTCNFLSDSSILPLFLSIIPISPKNPKPIHSTSSSSNTTTSIDDHNESTDQGYQFSSQRSNLCIKVPTPPWIRGPITLESNQLLDLSNPRNNKNSSKNEDELTGKVSGGRGKKTMKKVFEGVEKLVEKHNSGVRQKNVALNQQPIEYDFGLEEIPKEGNSKFGGKLPWERDERVVFRRTKKEKKVTAAELKLDVDLLERLRKEASRIRKWVKVKKAGVTDAVVDHIHFIWKNDELAMLKFDLPLCRNMDRATEIVEIKTGGLVVWSKKDELVIYRGFNYKYSKRFSKTETSVPNASNKQQNHSVFQLKSNYRSSILDEEEATVPVNGSLFEREADRLLDGLGPRFIDWWYHKPLPVDADLLTESVPGFKTPFRLCPPDIKSNNKLTDDELTHLRNLARPLPIHFVLGRNRKLQGLAVAILKLWEKCHIAKIAVKLGVPNTDNEQMANELKRLTGGIILLRNKYYIVLYRGKDFLPCNIANLVIERETELSVYQNKEESARHNSIEPFYMTDEPSSVSTSIAQTGTLMEFNGIICKDLENGKNREAEVEKERLNKELKTQENKLFILKKKIKRTGRELAKLNSSWRPSENDGDRELITHEERECFWKIGLKMDKCLVLGRRGIFDGVIEGMHQHWKHREIVKVITMQRVFSQVIYTAKLVELESGGVLVSVNKLKEGHAIILYRGKNYKRPLKLVPQNLLNKQDALRRSLDLQRIGSLKFFAHQREKKIYELKCKLAEVQKEVESIRENEISL